MVMFEDGRYDSATYRGVRAVKFASIQLLNAITLFIKTNARMPHSRIPKNLAP
jgi:hypothetical protein